MRTRHMLAAMCTVALLTGCGLVAPRDAADPAAEGDLLAADADDGGVVELARFFGDCDDATLGVTDVTQATNECEVIQILTNAFNAENDSDIAVERLGGAQFAAYYDTLNATYAGGAPPDVAVMHAANLPDYASRGLLVELDDEALDAIGVDPDAWTEPAREAVTNDGVVYGVPFDVHANLWHINTDLLAQAGLVDSDGAPILPTNRDELVEHAERVREATGAQYFAIDASQFALDVMMFITLLYQQGGTIVSEDGERATLDSEEGRTALEFMNLLFDESIADRRQDYTAAQSAFLSGDAAVLHNGTWVVNQYAAEADFDYQVRAFPTLFDEPATWSNSHVWVIPVQESPDRYREALEYIGYLSENDISWAVGTGHLPVTRAALEDPEYVSAPQRAGFAEDTIDRARLLPTVGNWQPIEDVIKRSIESTWLTGASVEDALRDAQREIDILLDNASP